MQHGTKRQNQGRSVFKRSLVNLSLADSKDLVEKTNREGFVESPAYRALRTAVQFAVAQAEAERNIDKQRIRQATNKERHREPVMSDLADLRTELSELKLEKEKDRRITHYVDRIEVQYKEIVERFLTAAGAGLNLAVVLHEVEKNIRGLHSAIQRGDTSHAVLDRAKHLADLVDGLTWLTRQSGTSDVDSVSLIKNCLFVWSYRFANHKIEIVNGTEQGDPPFVIRGTRRLLMTALMNLLDNSIYWTSSKRVKGRKIYIGTTFELTGKPAFVVADNGPGFQDPEEYLTMPFFTRKLDGTGLGMHIADEVMKMHDGRLAVVQRGDITLPSEFDGAIVLLQFGGRQE